MSSDVLSASSITLRADNEDKAFSGATNVTYVATSHPPLLMPCVRDISYSSLCTSCIHTYTYNTAGGYCPIGSSFPEPCPHSTFNNFSGAADPADCSDCLPGYYCSGTSNPSPTGPCYAGHFCTGGASTPTQYTTDPGYYAPIGSSAQYPCEPGTYNAEVS